MAKRYLTDPTPDSRPYRPKQQRGYDMPPPARRNNDHSTQSPTSPPPSGGKMCREKALETLARYEEMERLFSSQFPSADSAAISASQMPMFMPQAGFGGMSSTGFNSSPEQGSDGYDPDQELAWELNEDMGLIARKPDPTVANAPLFECSSTTSDQNIHPALLSTVDSNGQYYDHNNTNYPFTSPAGGELMVSASPEHASYTRTPRWNTRAGEAVEDLSWLGNQLQENARRQLQNLHEGGQNVSY